MVAHTSSSQNDDGRSTSSSPCLGVVGGGVGKPSHHAPVLKKGPWTAAEDAILMEYVKKHGEGNWNAVQKNTSLVRCGKSCRLRWTNHLRPNLRKGSFTPEEERLILQLHSQLGNKWARMAAQLPGRTDNEIKNYWNTRIKRRIRQGLPLYNPHDGNNPQEPPIPPPETQSATTSFRPRPRIEIPARNFSQQQNTSPVGLHPLKTIYNNLSIFDPSFSSISFNNFNPRYTDQTLNQNQNPNLNPYFPLTSSFQQSMLPTNPNSFQFTPLGFNMNSPQSLHTLFEAEAGLSDCPIYSVGNKELPSNQMYLFQTEKLETEATAKPENNRGLLEDLFKEAEAFISPQDSKGHNLFNFQDDKFDSSLKSNCGWDTTVSDSLSAAGSSIKVDTKDPISIQDDLSKLINFPASSSSLTPEHCNGNGVEDLGGQSSPGYASGLTDDGLGLEMQHIASLFQTDYSQTGDHAPCYWDNLPRIC